MVSRWLILAPATLVLAAGLTASAPAQAMLLDPMLATGSAPDALAAPVGYRPALRRYRHAYPALRPAYRGVQGPDPSCPWLRSWNPANPDRGYCDPGFAFHGNINGCAYDEGYGRWSSCDHLR